MIYKLTPEEQEDVSALLAKIDLAEIPARRLAVELVLLRHLLAKARRILPRHLEHIGPDLRDQVARIPLPSQKPAWDALCEQRFEPKPLIAE